MFIYLFCTSIFLLFQNTRGCTHIFCSKILNKQLHIRRTLAILYLYSNNEDLFSCLFFLPLKIYIHHVIFSRTQHSLYSPKGIYRHLCAALLLSASSIQKNKNDDDRANVLSCSVLFCSKNYSHQLHVCCASGSLSAV